MLIQRLAVLVCIIGTRGVSGQAGPILTFSFEGAGSPLAPAAQAVYERAGGFPATVSGTLGIGIGSRTLRAMLFGATGPATMSGSTGRQGADRQTFGLRVEGVRALSSSWSVVGVVAASRQRLVRTWVAPLPDGTLDVIDPPGPGQLSQEYLSWSGTGIGVGVGGERRVSRRIRARVIVGGLLTTSQAGNWESFTQARAGSRVAPTLEVGLLSAFGQRR